MQEIEDLGEITERLSERIEKLENDRRVTGLILGLLIAGVIYLLFFR